MIDQDRLRELKGRVDLYQVASRYTRLERRPSTSTRGGEFHGPCPLCGGTDRFWIHPNDTPPAWRCRGCDQGGDAIALVMAVERVSFLEACRILGADVGDRRPDRGRGDTHRPVEVPSRGSYGTPASPSWARESEGVSSRDEPPSLAWQDRGRAFVAYAQRQLWGEGGQEAAAALAYLIERRGLTEKTISRWGLGYNPRDQWDEPARWGFQGGKRIWCARGIVVPCEIDGVLWYAKVRRPWAVDEDELVAYVGLCSPGRGGQIGSKYIYPRGYRPALFGAAALVGHSALLLTEGELDAILAWQEAGDLVDVATVGSSNSPLPARWVPALLPYPRLLVCYDLDEGGEQGAARWSWTARAIRVRLPLKPEEGNDITDFWRAGGDLRGWLSVALTGAPVARDRTQHEAGDRVYEEIDIRAALQEGP